MIRSILNLYIFVLILDIIISYIPSLKRHQAALYIKKAADVTCRPVRKVLSQLFPSDFPVDLSHMVVILGIKLLEVFW